MADDRNGSGWLPDRRVLLISAVMVAIALVVSVVLFTTGDDESTQTATDDQSEHSDTSEQSKRPRTTRTPSTTKPRPPSTAASAPRPTAPPGGQALAVSEQGFSVFRPESLDYTVGSYGAVLTNPNPAFAATNVDIDVTFADNGGRIVGSQSEFLPLVLPGQPAAIGGPLGDLDAATTTMTVAIRSVQFQPIAATSGAITVDGVTLTADASGNQTTMGTAHSSFTTDAVNLLVVSLYRDANNQIVGGDYDYVDELPAGGQAEFEIEGFYLVPNAVTATPIAILSAELLGG